MIRKKAAIFFILFASVFILAHAVIPHHHHHGQICFVSAHCNNDGIENNHNDNADCHRHDGNGTETCVLKQAVVIPSNSLKHELKCADRDDNKSSGFDFHAFIFSVERILFVPKIISVAQIPSINSSHSSFVFGSKGLRAPPTV